MLPRVNIAQALRAAGPDRARGACPRSGGPATRALGRIVCLKLLDKEKTAKFEARFPGTEKPKEGDICMALRHENIVQTYEYGITTEGEPYLVMELVDGMGLNYLIETQSPATGRQARSTSCRSWPTPWSTCTSRAICTATSARATPW